MAKPSCWQQVTAILLFLAMGGCGLTPQGDYARSTVATKGAEIMDSGLDSAHWFICYGASVGRIKRRYGKSQEMADIYWGLCYDKSDEADVIGPGAPAR